MHRIAIIGGSAGDLELATRLGDRLDKRKRAHITLVNRSPAQVCQPLLHEVAAGSLDIHSHQIEFATQAHRHHFTFVQGELTGLDRSAKLLRAGAVHGAGDKGEVLPAHTVKHDTLVMAPGGRMYFFGVPGAKDQAIGLDSLKQAEPLRRQLLETCVRKRVIGETGTRERMWTLQLSEAAPRAWNFRRSMANATEPPAGAPRAQPAC